MYYGKLRDCDIANGVGVRVTLFVSGCTNHCEGCFQPETWSFTYGKEFDVEAESRMISLLQRSYIDGLTILGGEPMEPENQKYLLPIVKRVKHDVPNKTIWCYTGYVYEDIIDSDKRCHCRESAELMRYIDVLVDGKFEIHKKDISLRFRGSINQRIIDVPASLSAGRVIELDI